MLHSALNGADLHAPTNYICENDTGSDIPILTVVTITGIGTAFPSIRPAVGSVDTYRGVTMQDFPIASSGYITGLGFMIGVNTSAWPEGTLLYCNATGQLVTTPAGPLVATVYKQDPVNGYLYIEAPSASGGGGSGDVVGPPSSTNTAIPSWDGTSGKLLNNSTALLQASGAIEAQGFLTMNVVTGTVTVNTGESWIAPSLSIAAGGAIILQPGAELIIV